MQRIDRNFSCDAQIRSEIAKVRREHYLQRWSGIAEPRICVCKRKVSAVRKVGREDRLIKLHPRRAERRQSGKNLFIDVQESRQQFKPVKVRAARFTKR